MRLFVLFVISLVSIHFPTFFRVLHLCTLADFFPCRNTHRSRKRELTSSVTRHPVSSSNRMSNGQVWSKTCPESLQPYLLSALQNLDREAKEHPWLPRGKSRFRLDFSYNSATKRIYSFETPLPGSACLYASASPVVNSTGMTLLLMLKNEAPICERAMKSLLGAHPCIDSFIVLDTGSTDGTVDVLKKTLGHLPGAIYYLPSMIDFGTGRTILMHLGHQHRISSISERKQSILTNTLSHVSEWGLLMDADYVVQVHADWRTKNWTHSILLDPESKHRDAEQLVLYTSSNMRYSRPHIVRMDVKWCYQGRTHEHLSRDWSSPGGTTRSAKRLFLDGVEINHIGDGGNKASKGPRDMNWLFMDLIDDFEPKRSFFYAGNTAVSMNIKDGGRWLHSHAMRLFGWMEEDYYSSRQYALTLYGNEGSATASDLIVRFGRAIAVVLHGLSIDPYRLESLMELCQSLRAAKEMELECALASLFLFNERPVMKQQLFVNVASHQIHFPLELFIASMNVPWYMVAGQLAITEVSTLVPSETIAPFKPMIAHNQTRYADWCQRALSEPCLVVTKDLRVMLDTCADRQFRVGQIEDAYATWRIALAPMVFVHELPQAISYWLSQQPVSKLPVWMPTVATVEISEAQSMSSSNEASDMNTLRWVSNDQLRTWSSRRNAENDPLLAFKYGRRLDYSDSASTSTTTTVCVRRAKICVKLFYCSRQLNHSVWRQCAHLIDAWKYNPSDRQASVELVQLSISTPRANRHPSVSRAILYLVRQCTLALAHDPTAQSELFTSSRSTVLDDMVASCEPRNQVVRSVWNPVLRTFKMAQLSRHEISTFADANSKDNSRSDLVVSDKPKSTLDACFERTHQLNRPWHTNNTHASGPVAISSLLDSKVSAVQIDRSKAVLRSDSGLARRHLSIVDHFWNSATMSDVLLSLQNRSPSTLAGTAAAIGRSSSKPIVTAHPVLRLVGQRSSDRVSAGAGRDEWQTGTDLQSIRM